MQRKKRLTLIPACDIVFSPLIFTLNGKEKMAKTSTASDSAAAPSKRTPKGEGTALTIDFKEYPDLLKRIRDAAKADDREPAKWLRRRIVILYQSGLLEK